VLAIPRKRHDKRQVPDGRIDGADRGAQLDSATVNAEPSMSAIDDARDAASEHQAAAVGQYFRGS